MKETCQLCGVSEIASKVYNKLDEAADDRDLVICRDCYKGRSHEAIFEIKASTKTALLVRLTWIRNLD